MNISGSCYCQAVTFSVLSHTPYPYMRCYCSFCRKTSGGGGYAINIMAEASTLKITGAAHVSFLHGQVHNKDTDALEESRGGRYFCRQCGSPLWQADPRWPDWIYPYASAIETPLPAPPETVHIMLDFKAPWVMVPTGEGQRYFERYPNESIVAWHQRHGLYS